MTGAWRNLREKLHGARRLEWLALLVILSVAALLLFKTGDTAPRAPATELETRLERVLTKVAGAGDVRAMVTERGEKIVGVVIVAEGAEEVRVRLALMQAARALLDIELSQIEVMEMRRDDYAQAMDTGGLLSGGAGGGNRGAVAGPV